MSSDTVPVTQAASFAEWLKRYVGKQDANAMRFSVAELEIAFNAGRTTPAPAMPSREEIALDCYDAGLLGDGGGGNVEWWQDYIRAELNRAHEFYAAQLASLIPASVETDKLREALRECRDQLWLLAKDPENNPWIKQADAALSDGSKAK
jgi:hypothetical protein